MECEDMYPFAKTGSGLRLRGIVRGQYQIVVIDGLNLRRVARATDREHTQIEQRGIAESDTLPFPIFDSVDPERLLPI